MRARIAWISWLLALVVLPAQAHKPSSSYLRLAVDAQGVSGRWDIALRDLEDAIGLDTDGDGAMTWGEVRGARGRIAAYALSRLAVSADGERCVLEVQDLAIADHSDGAYAALTLGGRCPQASRGVHVDYGALFDVDAQHRGLARVTFAGHETSIMFAPGHRTLEIGDVSRGAWRVFADYFREGLHHVWSGADHLLFLAGLFLPAILRRRNGAWIAATRVGTALRETAIMATAFTIAHAVTLSLAATGAFSPPSRLVESAVAATVFFAGFNNLVPMVYRELYVLAAFFGLIHGAAVASALIELGLPPGARTLALLAFNLGVEAAQLSLLLIVIPPCFALRHRTGFRRFVFVPAAAAVALIGLVWFVERASGLSLGVPLP